MIDTRIKVGEIVRIFDSVLCLQGTGDKSHFYVDAIILSVHYDTIDVQLPNGRVINEVLIESVARKEDT
jgi:hypothetical protein